MRGTWLVVVVAVAALAGLSEAATVTWSNLACGPVTNNAGQLVPGTVTFGEPVLSNGALVQLWKAVGTIDDPHMQNPAYAATEWKVDDVFLGEVNCGYGTFMAPEGAFDQTGNYPVVTGDTIYVRAYNIPKPDWTAANVNLREVGIRDVQGAIVSNKLTRDDIPLTFCFGNLKTEPIPEPASLLFLVPGLAVWALRRKK